MLITIEDLKQHIDLDTNEYDAVLAVYANAISDFIRNYLGRPIVIEAITEYFDGDDIKDQVHLSSFPVVIDDDHPFTFKYASGPYSDLTWEDFSADDYQVDEEIGIIYTERMWSGRKNIKVTYSAGYATVPNPVKLAAMKLVAKVFNSRKSDGFKDESLGDASISWDKFMSDDITALLAKYRRISL